MNNNVVSPSTLVKSLRFTTAVAKGAQGSSPNSKEFLKIHERNRQELTVLASQRGSKYMLDKLDSYPTFGQAEVEEYIKSKRGHNNLLRTYLFFIGGFLLVFFSSMFKTMKTKGKNLGATKSKMESLIWLNGQLTKVVANPELEQLITDSKKDL